MKLITKLLSIATVLVLCTACNAKKALQQSSSHSNFVPSISDYNSLFLHGNAGETHENECKAALHA